MISTDRRSGQCCHTCSTHDETTSFLISTDQRQPNSTFDMSFPEPASLRSPIAPSRPYLLDLGSLKDGGLKLQQYHVRMIVQHGTERAEWIFRFCRMFKNCIVRDRGETDDPRGEQKTMGRTKAQTHQRTISLPIPKSIEFQGPC